MTDSVGWAIIDYLRNGRPYTDSPNVFVKHRLPYDAFPINSTMNHIFSTVMNKAGIPPEMKEHVGWHTFRRSLAANLLKNNVEISSISEIFGHSDPDIAGRYYVKLDIENLKHLWDNLFPGVEWVSSKLCLRPTFQRGGR